MKANICMLSIICSSTFSVYASAQTPSDRKLPACQGNNTSIWNMCFGARTYPNGDKYAGEWKLGKADGQGTYILKSSGTAYVGEFVAYSFSGHGTMTWSTGAKFVGNWNNDEGVNGTVTFMDGSTLSGTPRVRIVVAPI